MPIMIVAAVERRAIFLWSYCVVTDQHLIEEGTRHTRKAATARADAVIDRLLGMQKDIAYAAARRGHDISVLATEVTRHYPSA
jgi:hypothetical protein